MNFYTGFLAGVLLKDKVLGILGNGISRGITVYHKLHKRKIKSKNNKVYLVCKIIDHELFNDYFPVRNTKSRVQPHWEYNVSKGVFKINLEDPNLECEVKELLDRSGLDIEFFESFCELSVYVNYFHENLEYINIYQTSEKILPEDLNVKETRLSRKYKNIVCATFNMDGKTVYLTKYLKKFLNNTKDITIEQMLNYNDEINTLKGDLQIVDSKIIKMYSVNEKI
jgi:hypothetical protein